MHEDTDVFIISDIHLGAAASASADVLHLLKTEKYKKLLILGDLFDHQYIKRLRPDDWNLLKYLEEKATSGLEIVWLKGNHDREFPHQLSHLSEIPVIEEYAWEQDGKKYIAIHGDQFDTYILKKTFINKCGELFSKFMLRFNMKRKFIMMTIGKLYGKMIHLSDIVADNALKYAKSKGANYIICGHTHFSTIKVLENGQTKIQYLNSGSWTQSPANYITISKNGPKVRTFQKDQ